MAVCQPLLYWRWPVMPTWSARACKCRDLVQCLLHFAFGADDADQVLHGFLQIVLNLIRILAGSAAIEGLEGGFG